MLKKTLSASMLAITLLAFPALADEQPVEKKQETPPVSPFGFVMGQDKSTIEFILREKLTERDESKGEYYSNSSPVKLSEMMGTYILTVSHKDGLCYVLGASDDISTNTDGSNLIFKINKLKDKLSNQYGEPTEIRDSYSGFNWFMDPNPKDWMKQLKKRDREYTITWKKPKIFEMKIVAVADEKDEYNTTGNFILLFKSLGDGALCLRAE